MNTPSRNVMNDLTGPTMIPGKRVPFGRRQIVALIAISLMMGTVVRLGYAVAQDPRGPTPPVSAAEARRDLGTVVSSFARDQTGEEVRLGQAAAEAAKNLETESVPGENLALLRSVQHGPTDLQMALWPAEDRICFAFEGAASCVGAKLLTETGIVPLAHLDYRLGPNKVLLGGAAVDGISEVSVEREGASPLVLRVRDNTFLGEVEGRPTGLHFTDAGRVEREIPLYLKGQLDRLGPPSAQDMVD